MTTVIHHLLELLTLVAASVTWMFIKDRAGVLVMAALFGGGVCLVGWFCSWLRRELPAPRGTVDGVIYCLGLLACAASVFAATASYAIGHVSEALSESVAQFTKDCFSSTASAWQRSTLEASASRLAAAGIKRSADAPLVMRGAMTFSVDDAASASLVGEQYVRHSLQRFGEAPDWKYALWSRWIASDSPEIEARINSAVADLPKGATTISGDPAASPLTARAVELAGGIAASCISSGIESYVETKQIEFWVPASLLWVLVLGLLCLTARLRFDSGFARLSRMP